jgi:hypothetical protein
MTQADDEGREYVCFYLSKLLKDAERRYGSSELECLCVVWAVNKLRVYLYGAQHTFIIVTDNSALKALLSLKNPVGRLGR